MKDIIDVSRYQGTIDWDKLAGKIGGAMLKTVSTNKSFGGIYIDPMFERNYSECKRLGIPVGAYYYTYAQNEAAVQAELAKLHEALSGKSFELPIAVDVEDNKLKALSADALTDLVIAAARTIEGWGLYAMVYTYTAPPASMGCGSTPAPARWTASPETWTSPTLIRTTRPSSPAPA